jgi:hypothetical protein
MKNEEEEIGKSAREMFHFSNAYLGPIAVVIGIIIGILYLWLW